MKIEIKKEEKQHATKVVTSFWITIDGWYIEGTLSDTLEEAEQHFETLKTSKGGKLIETVKSEEV